MKIQKIKLFCFAYAGGSVVIFNKWKQLLNERIELVPIELSGRGKRIQEPLYPNVTAAVEDVYKITKELIDEVPYAIFGHSMGSMIAYHLSQKLRKNNYPAPLHIFFSGRSAPHFKRPDGKKFHLLGEDEFRKEIITLGGTPPEFFDHPELLEIFIPLLKNDFKLSEAEMLEGGEINPLDSDISVFVGKDDDLTKEQCEGWKKHTTKLCKIHFLDGGHFFIHDQIKQIVKLINNTLIRNNYA